MKTPLVSIVIPNYNYACYLRKCLDSAINQTYSNIEIIIQDNNSDDESYEILREYEKKSKDGEIKPYINVAWNKRNVGSDKNSTMALERSEGEYVVFLSSDDALKPTFVERCVQILEKNHNVGMVMVHRDEIDENDCLHTTIPFFNCDFIAEGESQAAVFMMAGIAVPSQIMLRRSTRNESLRYRYYAFQIAGDWYSNFMMACVADVAYIQEALCEYRVHSGNETNESEKKLLGIFEHFQLINAFDSTSKSLGMNKCTERYGKAIEKLGEMCLRYALKMLKNEKIECAKKYLYLAPVFKEDILEENAYQELWDLIHSYNQVGYSDTLETYQNKHILERTCSYEPPEVHYKINKQGEIIES